MKLKVLVDNNTYIDEYYCGEPGVCYYIEDGETKLLLDAGYSDVFLENAEKMHIALDQLDAVVLSHGHIDHTGGLPALLELTRNRPSLIAHPDAFVQKWYEGQAIGTPVEKQQAAAACRLILTKDPLKISSNLTFLGEIPRTVEQGCPIGTTSCGSVETPDYMADDTALVYKGREGIYIITACSHSGICNIIEYAKKVTGTDRVCGLIGGFHLFDSESELAKDTVKYLKKENIKELYPCHCTSFAVRAALHRESPVREVGVGLELNWE